MATLADLRTRVIAYADRTDPAFGMNLDFWINAGLRWLERQLGLESGTQVRFVNSTDVITGVTSIALPPTWRPNSNTRVWRQDGESLVQLSELPLDFLDKPFFDDRKEVEVDFTKPTSPGPPDYFLIRGRDLELRPASDAAYTLEIETLAYLAALTLPDDSNILTVEAEEACLYAALREVWEFYEDSIRASKWESKAIQAARDWMDDRHEARTAALPRQMGTYRV